MLFTLTLKEGERMEFLEILLALVALLLIIFRPKREKLAFFVLTSSWALTTILFIVYKSGNLLTIMNL